ncbi:unannotated protein [freshwater metagenome]|uniref:Unannotated protein n=1 Tax=freshwater metagenome TaxID=449393 RepID=A0A6J6GZK0_9ZZZZ
MNLGTLVGLEPFDGVDHRVVFGIGGNDDVSLWVFLGGSPVETLDGKVVGFGATGCENYLLAITTNHSGQVFTSALEHGSGGLAGGVNARRVSEF